MFHFRILLSRINFLIINFLLLFIVLLILSGLIMIITYEANNLRGKKIGSLVQHHFQTYTYLKLELPSLKAKFFSLILTELLTFYCKNNTDLNVILCSISSKSYFKVAIHFLVY